MKTRRARVGCASRLRAIDLFAGCGGLTLGLKRAGFQVIGAVDIDALAVETYRLNHPDVHVWSRDIQELRVSEILRRFGLKAGELELLAGCPPCQGFSALRRLNGGRRVRDVQNDLVFEFMRLVRGLRPRAVMLENVPGLASNYRFVRLKTELRQLGYRIRADIRDAQHYGVPQRRRRLILLAARGEKVAFPEPSKAKVTVRRAFQKLTPSRAAADPLHTLSEARSEKVRTLIRKIPKDGGSRTTLPADEQLHCHKSCDGFKDVYGRMRWDDVAPTITGGCCNPSKGRFLHPDLDRTISLREAALLQGFPCAYQFSLKRGKFAAAQMIGNALPTEFIRRHAAELVKVLRSVKVRRKR